MRRLTRSQIEATVYDVLAVEAEFPVADETLIGYRSNTSTGLDTTTARTLMLAAEATAAAAAPTLSRDWSCLMDCRTWLLDTVAVQILRRPLDAETRARFGALYDAGVAAEEAEGGIRWFLSGLLQSSRFLYALEAPNSEGRLDGYSIASRLSYSLWGGPPDTALIEAARSGVLGTTEGISTEAERMIDDPRFARGLGEFVDQWLDLDHLDEEASRPDFHALPEETRYAMRHEPVEYVASHIRAGSTIQDLLTSTETRAEPALDPIYGDDILSIDGEVANLDPSRRAGLLTLPGVLAALAHAEVTSPTLRGRAILANLLCNPPPPPPAGVPTTLPPALPGATTRQRLEAHFTNPSCAGCHAPMDGMGFTFERYDWLGRSREFDNGQPIDTTAEFEIAPRETVSVVDAPDLAGVLSGRREVAECVARHFSRFAVGVRETSDFDCTVQTLADAAEGPTGLRGMVLAYVTSAWFIEPGTPIGEAE